VLKPKDSTIDIFETMAAKPLIMSTRTSERIRKQEERAPKQAADSIKYFSGQGLAVRSGTSFSLAVALDDVASDEQSFQVTRLRPGLTANKYEEGDEAKIMETDVLTDIDIKKTGASYRVTRKQLQDLRKDLGMVEEKPPRDSSRGRPSKRAKSAGARKGKINPNIIVSRTSEVKDSKTHEPFKTGSVCYNERNLFRAARLGNVKLLKSIVAIPSFISSFDPYWNPDNHTTPVELAVRAGDLKFLKEYLSLAQKEYSFATVNMSSIQRVNTGSVSTAAYGVHVRAVNMSRGGREGNNAFLADLYMGSGHTSLDSILSRVGQWVTPKIYDFLQAHINDRSDMNSLGYAVRCGNLELAAHIMEARLKNGGYGFNQLHFEVLGSGPLTPFKKVSVTKKPIENFIVAPLHCAAINPDHSYLEALLAQCDDMNYPDNQQRKAIHYAAACVSGSTVKLLIDSGANVNDPDRFKVTPLMIAAEFNRSEAAEALLAAGAVATAKNRQGDSAICIAAQHDSLDVLRLLLNSGVDIESTGTNKRTPLMCAAMMGNFECAEELISRGAKVMKRDKHRKTALLYAAKNGEYAIVSLLLHHGADPNDPDSSKNSALHYAASSCWPENIDLLLEGGADINAQNDWKLSPLLIALLKGHSWIVTKLLQKPAIDVNCKDESGRTILSLAIEMLSEETLEQMAYLLNEKAADPNIPDLAGSTALHHLARLGKPVCPYTDWTTSQMERWVEQEWTFQVRACELLLSYGANVNAANAEGSSPVLWAVTSKNTRLIQVLMKAGADLYLQDSKGSNIFHLTAQFDKDLWEFVLQILQDRSLAAACLNSVDDEGYTPFLRAIKHFQESNSAVYSTILAEVTDELTGDHSSAMPKQFKRSAMKVPRAPARITKTARRVLSMKKAAVPSPAFQFTQFNTLPQATPAKMISIKPAKSSFATPSFGATTFATSALATAQSEDEQETSGFANDPHSVHSLTQKRFDALVNEFIGVLQRYIQAGADQDARVQKIKKYREDPDLIKKEYEEDKITPVQNIYWYQPPTAKREFFIEDFEGNRHWNEYNSDGLSTALHLACKFNNPLITAFLTSQAIDLNARDFKGLTALAVGAESGLMSHLMDIIITAGADLNIVSHQSESPLLKAVKAKSLDNTKLLVSKGALLDIQTTDMDSALKNAVNQKFLKLVEVLCEGGANPDLPDNKNRTPLHHAFNMAETSADASFDIEAVLLEHGADINAMDRRGRTPLHYAFVKIGKAENAVFIDPIETVSSACSVPNLDVNIQDFWGKTPLHYSAQHGSITSAMFLMSKNADFEIRDNCGNTALTLSYIYSHPNYSFMMIQKGSSVTLPVVVPPKPIKHDKNKTPTLEDEDEEEVGQQNQFSMFGGQVQSQVESGGNMKEGTYSQFRAAVIHEWQGVAYLLLFNGFDYMLAMQDAMSEHKFQLVLTLLAKVQDNSIIQQVNARGQNLYHTLAMYGANANYELTTAIGEKLLKRKVQLSVKDQDGRTPLHYAAESHYSFLVLFLIDHGCAVDPRDNLGITPLELAIRGKKVTGAYNIIKTLKSRGAQCNIMITEERVTMTPLIHAVMQGSNIDLVKMLMADAEVLNLQDSFGRTVLIHAVKNNDVEVVEALLATGVIDLDIADAEGKNVVHHIVKSCEFGSYENTEILYLIHNAGELQVKTNRRAQAPKASSSDQLARYTMLDTYRHSPYWYAAHQGSGRMKKALTKLQVSETVEVEVHQPEAVPPPMFNFHTDAEVFISEQQEVSMEIDEPRKPDPNGSFENYYEVIGDYDLLMTKIDIKFGPYGGYVFYRMQLLRDTNRDVTVLFTRWGRIGEVGMNQRTAFGDLPSGESEFRKIFKQKSGNEWGTPFNPVQGKYKVLPLSLKTYKHNDFLKPLNYDGVPTSLQPSVAAAMKVVTDVKLYHLQFQSFQINVEVLNFSNIPHSMIEEAETVLKEISRRNKKLSGGKVTDTTEMLTLKQEVMDLSSRYYELIPKLGYENVLIPPIVNDHDLKANFDLLHTLRNVEAASKMLLGAKLREKVVSPLDYIVSSMQLRLEAVETESAEHQLLAKYVVAGGHSMDKVASIIRVERSSEADRIKQWSDVKNRKLLWHGSTNANFVGILSQGLKIAPREAPAIGWMFGKGLYFADYMTKSLGYTESGASHSFILLCEVVLGKMHTPDHSQTTSKAPKGCMSTYAEGYSGPDFSQSVYLKDGVEVPCGEVVNYEYSDKKPRLVSNSEYIVYDESQVRIRYLVHLTQKPHS
jgi:ankyrin repeat protein